MPNCPVSVANWQVPLLAGVKGIFHADELPAYGITADEVSAVRSSLSWPKVTPLCCAALLHGKPVWPSKPCLTALVWHGTEFPKKFETLW